MKPKAFAQPTWITLQGDYVFNLLQRYPDHAEFALEGFGEDVLIYDYRQTTMDAVDALLAGELDDLDFAPQFNQPAFVTIGSFDILPLIVTLTETDNPDPDYRFWVAVGINNQVPVYDYCFTYILPYGQDQNAFLSLYQRPDQEFSSPDPLWDEVVFEADDSFLEAVSNW